MASKHFFILIAMISLFAVSRKPQFSSNQNNNYRSISVEEAQHLLSTTKEIEIVDVRTPAEVLNGIIPGAMKIDVLNKNFISEISNLDKSKTYLVYCKSGSRSKKAANLMLANGFQDVINMKGGYSSWPK